MSPSNSNSQTKGESSSLGPAPRSGSITEQQIWAFRRYHGIGLGGRRIEEWTQQEIADALGVSRQTIDRWMNRETIAKPVISGLSQGQRYLLYSMAVAGKVAQAEEYLTLLELEGRLTKGQRQSQVTSLRREESEPHPLDGLDEEANLW